MSSCSGPSSGMVGWLSDLLECLRWLVLRDEEEEGVLSAELTGELCVALLGRGEVDTGLQGGEHRGEMDCAFL